MKKIIASIVLASGLLVALVLAKSEVNLGVGSSFATSTDPSSTSTDPFAGWVGLQVPADWQSGGTDNSTYQSFQTTDGLFGLNIPAGETAAQTSEYPNGPRLIKMEGSETVYWVSSNYIKIPMFTEAVFLSYNNKFEDVDTVEQDEFDFYEDCLYIRLSGAGAIYKVEGGTKRYIPSAIWNPAGIGVDQIIDVNKTDFNSYKTGTSLTSADEL